MKHAYFLIVVIAFIIMPNAASAGNGYQSKMYDRGYAADIQIGGGFDSYYSQGTLSTSHGYRFGNGLYVGGGIGFGMDGWDMSGVKYRFLVQYFADIKYSFINGLASPFVSLRAGGMYDHASVGTGYMLRPAVGVDIWRISVTLGYDFHNLKYYYGIGSNGNHNYGAMGRSGVYIGLSYNF